MIRNVRPAAVALLAAAGTMAVAVLLLAGVGLSHLVNRGEPSSGYKFVSRRSSERITVIPPTTLWFNPRYGEPYIGLSTEWQVGNHSYRTRDLMGRAI